MKRNTLLSVICIVFVLLSLWNFSLGIGWLVGWLGVGLLRIRRERFYNYVMDSEKFSAIYFVFHSLGILGIIAGSMIVAFIFKSWISPYTVFLAFFGERMILFMDNLLMKGGG